VTNQDPCEKIARKQRSPEIPVIDFRKDPRGTPSAQAHDDEQLPGLEYPSPTFYPSGEEPKKRERPYKCRRIVRSTCCIDFIDGKKNKKNGNING
jgi:hypothetical protein